MKALLIYLAVINVVTFCVYAADKYFAIKNMWRVPERTLLLLAAAGGSIGALFGIFLIRHKTRHKRFALGVPLMAAAHMALLAAAIGEGWL